MITACGIHLLIIHLEPMLNTKKIPTRKLEPTKLLTEMKILFQDTANLGLMRDAATVMIVNTLLGLPIPLILIQER